MSRPGGSRSAVLQWVVVLVVGVLVVAIVLGLKLIPRLSDGQKVLNAAKPAFTSQRLAGDTAGLASISNLVNLSQPIVEQNGGAAAEVPALVAYAARTEHVSDAQALALLQHQFPHTTALLGALPLSSVSAEIPHLLSYLSTLLKLSPAQLDAALKANFPAIDQAVTNLPAVTKGWDNVPKLDGLTRFNGTAVTTVPELRTYYQKDVVPTLVAQKGNFDSLDGTSSLSWIAPLLLIVGIIVILFAAAMIALNLRAGVPRRISIGGAAVVPVVGVVVVVLVLVLALIPRTSNGQKLLNGLRPAFTAQRVAGDRGGIEMVSTIVNTLDPIMTPSGGAAAEVPKLVAFVASKTGLPPGVVLATLKTNFPHTTALLEALPLTAVSAELTGVVQTLGAGVVSAVPALAQTVLYAPYVTGSWDHLSGPPLTRFDGTPVTTMAELRTYLSADVIPVLEHERTNYNEVVGTSNINFIGPLVLIIGLIVIAFGLLMVWLAWREPKPDQVELRSSPAPDRPTAAAG